MPFFYIRSTQFVASFRVDPELEGRLSVELRPHEKLANFIKKSKCGLQQTDRVYQETSTYIQSVRFMKMNKSKLKISKETQKQRVTKMKSMSTSRSYSKMLSNQSISIARKTSKTHQCIISNSRHEKS